MMNLKDRWFVPFLLLAALAARGLAAETKKAKPASKPVAAVFRLHGSLTETPSNDGFLFSTEKSLSLKDLVERMHKAADDEAIKAVVLSADGDLARRLPGGGSPASHGLAPRERERNLRPRRRPDHAVVRSACRRHAIERRADGRRLADRHVRRVAVPARVARQTGRDPGFPALRRLQERRRDVHARRPEPGGGGNAELAARRPLPDGTQADRQRSRRGRSESCAPGSMPDRIRRPRPKSRV